MNSPSSLRPSVRPLTPNNYVADKVPNLKKVPEPKHCSTAQCEVFASMYITYISVSKSTPLAVNGPYGQLASIYIVTVEGGGLVNITAMWLIISISGNIFLMVKGDS